MLDGASLGKKASHLPKAENKAGQTKASHYKSQRQFALSNITFPLSHTHTQKEFTL